MVILRSGRLTIWCRVSSGFGYMNRNIVLVIGTFILLAFGCARTTFVYEDGEGSRVTTKTYGNSAVCSAPGTLDTR